jgi:hypothetical protein
MRLLAIVSVVLAVAALYALADSELGNAPFYLVVAFVGAFLTYCCGSIERLVARLEELERAVARGQDSWPR